MDSAKLSGCMFTKQRSQSRSISSIASKCRSFQSPTAQTASLVSCQHHLSKKQISIRWCCIDLSKPQITGRCASGGFQARVRYRRILMVKSNGNGPFPNLILPALQSFNCVPPAVLRHVPVNGQPLQPVNLSDNAQNVHGSIPPKISRSLSSSAKLGRIRSYTFRDGCKARLMPKGRTGDTA
jgi:hypothetical protein